MIWIVLWILVGAVTLGWLYYLDWKRGSPLTVKELLIGIPWTLAGPIMLLAIVYINLRMRDWSTASRILNKPIIKGKKK